MHGMSAPSATTCCRSAANWLGGGARRLIVLMGRHVVAPATCICCAGAVSFSPGSATGATCSSIRIVRKTAAFCRRMSASAHSILLHCKLFKPGDHRPTCAAPYIIGRLHCSFIPPRRQSFSADIENCRCYTARMSAQNFVHLHTHSHYSLLEALPKIPALVAAAKADGQKALALTDNGNTSTAR